MSNVIQSIGGACRTVDVLKSGAVKALLELDAKISALKRMVELLRGSAQVIATPVLPRLPQLNKLTLSDYNQLRVACPRFGLPGLDSEDLRKVPGLKQLDALRNAVGNAYSAELDKLESSALGAIGQLQGQLDKAVSTALKKIGPVTGLIDCICSIQGSLITQAEANRAKSVLETISAPTKPTLIDSTLQQQMSLYNDAKATLKKAINPLGT